MGKYVLTAGRWLCADETPCAVDCTAIHWREATTAELLIAWALARFGGMTR